MRHFVEDSAEASSDDSSEDHENILRYPGIRGY